MGQGREQLECAGCKEIPQTPDSAFVGEELSLS